MRKETRTEERVVKSNYTVYIADDGKEFDNERKCLNYEHDIAEEKAREAIQHLVLENITVSPLTIYDDFRDVGTTWYKVETENDFKLIQEYCDLAYGDYYGPNIKSYPTTVCIVDSDDWYEAYTLDQLMEQTKEFFGVFGMNVNFDVYGMKVDLEGR